MAPVASMAMTDWATIASLATAGATLVLAAGTFASVRSANRAARTAERALLAGLRPVLAHSRLEDPSDKITWADNHWAKLSGGRASIELVDGNIYLAMSLRNVGAGIAVLQGWHPTLEPRPAPLRTELDQFRQQTRDLYVPAASPSSCSTATTKAASAPSASSRSPLATPATTPTSGCAPSPATGTSTGRTHASSSRTCGWVCARGERW